PVGAACGGAGKPSAPATGRVPPRPFKARPFGLGPVASTVSTAGLAASMTSTLPAPRADAKTRPSSWAQSTPLASGQPGIVPAWTSESPSMTSMVPCAGLAFLRVTHFMSCSPYADLSASMGRTGRHTVTYASNDGSKRSQLMSDVDPRWLVLAWRLPSGPSTPRVTVWRSLRRLGAAVLTPGAAILPYRDDLQEQLDWLAQEIEELRGDAWVLPVA